ncbi:glycosyltransferase [Muricoccus aerilatus]|uniref:glycosyltransferase n=1 Tax=Muricoccus aerilatus TaxID=452982 RepID=UPI00069434B0|nr:glycosyltransferase [Roseomonas aerilata]
MGGPVGEGSVDPGALLARADAARDNRRWEEAAEAYAAFLRLRPNDRGILIQQGHCVKEAGDPAAALELYRRAEAMEGRDADIHLQIGHALKLLGRRGAAADAYGRAVALDPGGRDPWAEWLALRDSLPPPRVAGLLLDLSDLVSWYGHRRAPSGIQRVQAEIAAAGEAAFCAMHPEEDVWRVLPAPLFHRLHHLSRTGADTEDPAWREALGALEAWRRRGHVLRPGAGVTIVTLGSAWWLPRYASALRAARAAGARYVPVLHDCGPLVLPDVTPPHTRAAFGRWLSTLPVLADGVVAVSQATAAEYRRLMERHLPGWPVPPAMVATPDGRADDVPEEAPAPVAPRGLAARFGFGRRRSSPFPARPTPPGLPEGPYVLLVSSFEPRKNHLLAIEAWRRLLLRRGAAGTPRLVLAGRRAPGDGPVMEALRDSALAGHVTALHEVDDAGLAALYRGCLFTLYPSRHEGWGLPVSESLLHRRVALVSEIPSLMESGRQGAVFFTPNSAEDLATAAEGLIADPVRLAALEARIPRHGGLRPWAEVAETLGVAVRRLAPGEAGRRPTALPPCEPVRLGHGGLPGPHPAIAMAEALLQGANWHPAQDWGAWTMPGRAALRLPSPSEGPARVSLALRPPLGASGTLRITLSREGAEPTVAERALEEAEEVALEIGAGGADLHLVLEAPGTELTTEGYEVGVGAVAVAVMHGASLADRLAYLENRVLVPVRLS